MARLLAWSLLVSALAGSHGLLLAPLSASASARSSASMMAGEVKVKFTRQGTEAVVEDGTPLSLAAYNAGVLIPFSCKAGTCATCDVMMGGRRVRTCVTKVKKPWFGNEVSVTTFK